MTLYRLGWFSAMTLALLVLLVYAWQTGQLAIVIESLVGGFALGFVFTKIWSSK